MKVDGSAVTVTSYGRDVPSEGYVAPAGAYPTRPGEPKPLLIQFDKKLPVECG